MMVTDPISDFLTRIRNAQKAGHTTVMIPASNIKKAITEILYDQGYILKYKFDDKAGKQGEIHIAIKYDRQSKTPVIKELGRISKPGLRQYVRSNEIPKVANGLGIAIISTSAGLMTDKKARSLNIGGELLCYVY
ncbi:MAG: 30S ribosomal protein S8 [Saprospiraceae bacterium]|nr:30S ribosomal protein S8 [Saprospiraceae bacterium]MBK8110033.1 30S ribosomal protein S8 [Saprospiraceae bacterium]MBK8850563.1 30S ribosomal protein S8 [Saprospiraceae bacterium]MBK9689981.1 30S ribosomal protein S8 [Saprospiraceae bacterium]MBL0080987.1 30S ribosomal protein S8 [Saprospiraceae bacterium]